MNRITKFALTISAVSIIAGTSLGSAFADYKPNRKDTGPSREQFEELGFTGILPHDKVGFTMFQKPNTPTNELVLKVISGIPLEGCFDSMPFELEQKIEGKSLSVDLKFPIIEMDARKDCTKRRVMEEAETVIDLDELREKEINQMRLVSKYSTRSFDLDLNEHRILLEPRESVLQSNLEYWLLPENTVMLSVPMAKDDLYYKDKILQELAMVADNNGLIPIEEQIPEFMPNEVKYNKFYFLDTEGKVKEALNNNDSGAIVIGSIHKSEQYYGPNGKYDKKIPVDVIATLPELD